MPIQDMLAFSNAATASAPDDDDRRFARYLARLGFDHRPLPTLESLAVLQRRHMEAVPFENLDVILRRPIVPTTEAALRKVVDENRGGFCFELNEAFRALLVHLGFRVERIEGRVRLPDGSGYGAPFDHLALRVFVAEGAYLADVGFGDGPRGPLRLPDGEESGTAGMFRLRPESRGAWLLEHRRRGEAAAFRPAYVLSTAPRELEEFAAMCAFHQTSPDSPFTRAPMVTIATATGRKTLTADRFILTGEDGRTETRPDEDERAALLREHFGIVLS